MIDGAVSIYIAAFFTPPKSDSRKQRERKCAGRAWCDLKPDVDNIAKIILDALNGVAFSDDKQVVLLQVGKFYTLHNPGCMVTVKTTDEEEKTEQGGMTK